MIRTFTLVGFFSSRTLFAVAFTLSYAGKVMLFVAENISKRSILLDQELAPALAPDACSGFFSRLTLAWFFGFLRYGYSHSLGLADLGQHTKSSAELYNDFEVQWRSNMMKDTRYPLLRSLGSAFAKEIWAPLFPCQSAHWDALLSVKAKE